jgi:hypothetical protein
MTTRTVGCCAISSLANESSQWSWEGLEGKRIL